MLRPVIAIALVLRGIDILNNMAAVNIITQGTPGGATETLSYFIYRTAFRSFEQGYASAASVVTPMVRASRTARTKPRMREATVPAAIIIDDLAVLKPCRPFCA